VVRSTSALVVLAVVGLLATASGARAQGNDRSAPTGGRSALMGNTGVALASDGAAPFLNPATIVSIADHSFAFSVNFYSFGYQHFSSWHQPAGVDTAHFGNVALQGTGESTTSFNAFPSTLCLFFTVAGLVADEDTESALWRRGRQKLALCLGSLESQQTSQPALSFQGQTGAGTTTQVQSLDRSWSRFFVGPTYSVALSDVVSVGASLHGAYTSDSFVLDGSSATAAAGGGAIQSALGMGGRGHSLDFAAILGTTYRVGAVTLGASTELPALHILGAYEGNLQNQYASATGNTATLAAGNGSFTALPPPRVAVGVGVRSSPWRVELDASYDFAQAEAITTTASGTTTSVTSAGATPASFSGTYTIRTHGTVNMGAGAEYFLSPSFSLLGGASTNLTSLPALSPTETIGNLAQARTSWVNLSLGFGSYGPGGDILIGTRLGYGWGQTLAINPYVLPNDWAVIDTQQFSALLVLAGSTNLRTIGRAMKAVEHVVTEGKPEDAPK
jgi:hypothetical protein